MPIGQNVPIVDRLIKSTTHSQEKQDADKENTASNASNTNNTTKKAQRNAVSARRTATSNTVKMTFYVKQELLEQLYNYSYWDRMTVTEAFNTALADGLKEKNTAARKK